MVRLTKKTAPMEALLVDALPQGAHWVYEPKWDGFRCLAHKTRGKVFLASKSGRPLGRYFPDIVAALEAVKADDFVLDGELLIRRNGIYTFGDLQLRLHPAKSRVAKLVAEAPAEFMIFDLLAENGKNFSAEPFGKRRARLEKFFKALPQKTDRFVLSPQVATVSDARKWLKNRNWRVDGVMAKDASLPYSPGTRAMQKFKPIRTADCVVGGFRYGTGSDKVGSLLLGLYDDQGLLHHVGFTSAIANADKADLTAKLEKLVSSPGFTGRAPGGPSRWSNERSAAWKPLRSKIVVEVSFDHVTDGRFRHGTRLLRFRPDKAPRQCGMEQIE
jgi:ATP-dependent DNA ligase